MDTNQIELIDINKSFGKQALFNNVNYSFSPNLLNIVLGPNGVGKSTLLDILSGDAKPDSGEIKIDRKSLFYLKDIPQKYNLDKVKDFISYVGALYGYRRIEDNIFELVSTIKDKRLYQLSTGKLKKPF